MVKQKGQVQIKICDNNVYTFITTSHNILLAPDLRGRLFSIITLINLVKICLLYKGFSKVYYREKEKNAVTLPHSAQRKHTF